MHFFLTSAAVSLAVLLAAISLLGQTRSASRWLFMGGMLLLALDAIFSQQAIKVDDRTTAVNLMTAAVVAKALLPCVWLCFSLTYSRGEFRKFLQDWRIVISASLLLPLAFLVGVRAELSEGTNVVTVPEAAWRFGFERFGQIFCGMLLLGSVLVLVNLERTLTAAVGVARWRIKLFVVGIGLIFGTKVYTLSQALLFTSYSPSMFTVETGALLIGCLLMGLSYARKPFEGLEIYPSRAVLQSSLTIILAGCYLLVIGLLAPLVASLSGRENLPLQAFFVLLSFVGLAALLLSERFQAKLRQFVTRHFQRPTYDFRTTWTRYTQRTSGIVDRDALYREFARLTSETFQALSVALFLTDESGQSLRLVSSTGKAEPEPNDEAVALGSEGAEVLRKLAAPFDLESREGDWAEDLRAKSLEQFEEGGDRLAVPLVAVDQLIGVMVLADRVNGVSYNQEERELLGCIADHIAGSLLNRSLTEKLMQAAELGAFQTMATFFVHDLKNTASNLNLMLRNLPKRFDDPEYREDALRGIARTVDRINAQISGLSGFRGNPDVVTEPLDLNALLSEVIQGCPLESETKIVRNFQEIPPVEGDAEQLRSLFQNLLMNACEAIRAEPNRVAAGDGEIRVETGVSNGEVEVMVRDNGTGMDPEFVKESLFRPFRTTKKQGLGVGLFQCKIMLEAHGGRVLVETEKGKGSTFRLYFPSADAAPRDPS